MRAHGYLLRFPGHALQSFRPTGRDTLIKGVNKFLVIFICWIGEIRGIKDEIELADTHDAFSNNLRKKKN